MINIITMASTSPFWVQESGLSGSGLHCVNTFLTFQFGWKNRFLFIIIIQNIKTLINILQSWFKIKWVKEDNILIVKYI